MPPSERDRTNPASRRRWDKEHGMGITGRERRTRVAAFVTTLAVAAVAVTGTAWGFAITGAAPPTGGGYQAIVWYQDMFANPCGGQGTKASLGLVFRECKVSWASDGSVNTRAGWAGTVANAANEWATYDATRGRPTFSYYGPDGCNAYANELYCQAVLAHAEDLGPRDPQTGVISLGYAQIVFVCSYSTTDPCAIVSADVYVTTNGAANWYLSANGGSIGSTQYDQQGVWEHELGHALGLSHPTLHNPPVMACYETQGQISRIVTDDRNGLEYLYSGHGGWGDPQPAIITCDPNSSKGQTS
jgi:hypothetical protein